MKKETPIWLNLGCGISLASDFINVDNFLEYEDLKKGFETKEGFYKNARIMPRSKFVKGDICALPFKDDFADYIEANDVIEHIEMRMVDKALSEMYRVLKPGAKLGLSTTNFDALAKLWTVNVTGNKFETQADIDKMITLSQVIYGHQSTLGEFHKTPFNPYIIGYRLQMAGFKLENIKITIFPTNSPEMMPQLAYKGITTHPEGAVILTEMMWIEAIK